ncbi:MAG: hypothetical protein OJF60_000086 [Burkholderiaceae bacterium]|nr:MAG: hypothetical protein OJF60_000086 [Burkholderiaceae bacterium]
MSTQICLVSQQAAANLLPALDPTLKPEKVVLVVTRKMQSQAAYLGAVFKEGGIKVEYLKLDNERDYDQIANALMELDKSLGDDTVTLNITGGTKLMSVAAQFAADANGWSMFYVDADTDQVIWFGPAKKPPQQLREQLRLPHYLRSYGFSLADRPQRTQANSAQQQLTQNLVTQVGSLEDAITTLNALAQDTENRRSLSVQLNAWQRDSRSLDVLLRDFEHANMLTLDGDRIHFPSESARAFVKGGWLELHAINVVHQMTGPLGIRDKAVNLEITDEASGARNELDIAFMARNRLFVIECKTARIDRAQGGDSRVSAPKANDTLFKLSDNCRRIGGLGTRGMLLTYRKLREPELQLARGLGIAVVAGSDIARLAEKLRDWVRPAV